MALSTVDFILINLRLLSYWKLYTTQGWRSLIQMYRITAVFRGVTYVSRGLLSHTCSVPQHHGSLSLVKTASRLSLPIQSRQAISFCKNFKYYLHSKAARTQKQFLAARSVFRRNPSEDISIGAFLFSSVWTRSLDLLFERYFNRISQWQCFMTDHQTVWGLKMKQLM